MSERPAGPRQSASGLSSATMPDLAEVARVAAAAARAAGDLLREKRSLARDIQHKGLIDIVTDVDVQSEQLVRERILAAFPTHSVLGEEGGTVAGADPHLRWVVDPLDGTTNYAHGFPFYCVSIGFEVEGVAQVGAVYDPSLDELFLAVRGRGATLNGQPMRPSAIADLQQSLLATGFPYDRAHFNRALKGFEVLSLRSQAVRRAGSAALDLCYVACGRFEGYWEYVVRPWDVAAGALLVQEAGGTVTRINGDTFSSTCGEVLASNGRVHEQMLAALADVPG